MVLLWAEADQPPVMTEEIPVVEAVRVPPQLRMRQMRLLHVANSLETRLGKAVFQSIPSKPGVYFFRDAERRLLYIGQSHNLKARVGSYRHVSDERHPKRLQRLVGRAASVEWQVCDTAQAAIELERVLLLEHRPKHNRAGVWQGAPWWLEVVTVKGGKFEIWLSKYEVKGAVVVPRGFRYLHASLVRCLYRALHPQCELANYPLGMMNFVGPLRVRFVCDEGERMAAMVKDYARAADDALLGVMEGLMVEKNEYWEAELEALRKHYAARRRRGDLVLPAAAEVPLLPLFPEWSKA